MLFVWDSAEPGEFGEFVNDGFKLETSVVQTAKKPVRPKHANVELEIRPLDFMNEYKQVIENHHLTRGDENAEEYWAFWGENAISYLEMIEDGAGLWFGGFV